MVFLPWFTFIPWSPINQGPGLRSRRRPHTTTTRRPTLAFWPCWQRGTRAQGYTAGKEKPGEYGYRLVLAGVGHLETLIEVDVRYKFSVLGLDGVLELWFQIGDWQFTEKREGSYEPATWVAAANFS